MNVAAIQAVMSKGLGMVCATCTKFWRAREAGVPGKRCLGKSCCGPIGGKVFPEYEGPLTPEAMVSWCFVCGNNTAYAVGVKGHDGKVGVCEEHLSFLTDLEPLERPRRPNEIIVKRDGFLLTVDKLERDRPKTLSALLAENARALAREAND